MRVFQDDTASIRARTRSPWCQGDGLALLVQSRTATDGTGEAGHMDEEPEGQMDENDGIESDIEHHGNLSTLDPLRQPAGSASFDVES